MIAMLAMAFLSARWGMQQQDRTAGLAATATRHESARLAPGSAAMVLFDLREDTAVRVLDVHGRWSKIADGDRRGWVPSDALRERAVTR